MSASVAPCSQQKLSNGQLVNLSLEASNLSRKKTGQLPAHNLKRHTCPHHLLGDLSVSLHEHAAYQVSRRPESCSKSGWTCIYLLESHQATEEHSCSRNGTYTENTELFCWLFRATAQQERQGYRNSPTITSGLRLLLCGANISSSSVIRSTN